MTEYGRSGHEQREYYRLHYPGTDVLKNKLDIRQPELLAEAEQLYATDRLREALPAAAQQLDTDGLKAIHHHLFQDLYSWAGDFRTYTTGRGPAPFARPEFIEPALGGLFRELQAEKALVGLEKPQFVRRAAHYVNEINAVHPFVEGNGRTQRVWLRSLADQAGYSVQLRAQDKDAWNEASQQGFHGHDEPMVELIDRSTVPLAREQQRPRGADQKVELTRIFAETDKVPFKDEVRPKFLYNNAARVMGLPARE